MFEYIYIDIILLKLEPDLFKHLANHGVRAINYAWNWMSNGFQTVSSKHFIMQFLTTTIFNVVSITYHIGGRSKRVVLYSIYNSN